MPSSSPPPPAVLADRYRLERRFASGGMAEVWLATDTALSRQVAVKLLKPSLAADPVIAERFRREAVAAASLTHPNIVAVYDAVDDGGRQAVVMQFVRGKSLRQLLDEQQRLSPELTVHIGCAVAAALDAAHQAGLVHRDVKPGNVLVTPDGLVLLADFGIAKALDGTDGDLTSENVMMGTAKYLSPEQVRGQRLDGRADLYSLGLVLYECLAGRVPFLGETDADTALSRLQRDPTDLARLRPTLPRGLVDVIHRLLARDPEERYATGAEVRAALQQSLTRSAGRATGPAPAASGAPGDATSNSRTPSRLIRPPGSTRPGERTPVPSQARTGPTRPADRTPPSMEARRGHPARGLQHRWGPSLMVGGGLLIASLVAGLLLWSAIGNDGETIDTAAPAGPEAVSTTDAGVASGGPAPVTVVAATAYDPDGDGVENDDQVARVLDGDPTTTWSTVCYQSQYLGAKRGVGIVLELGAATAARIEADVASAPWSVQLHAAETMPSSIDGWGPELASDYSSAPGRLVATSSTPVRYVLVLLRELAPDPECSTVNPYRGQLSEVRVTAAP